MINMTDKFRVETERIGSTYVIRVYSEDKILLEILNWNSMSSSNAREIEGLVKELNWLNEQNEQKEKTIYSLKEKIMYLESELKHLHKRLATYGRVKSALSNMKDNLEKIWEFDEDDGNG